MPATRRTPVFLLPVLLVLAACGQTGDMPGDERLQSENELVENRGADKDNWWDTLPRPEWRAYERIPVTDEWFEVYRVIDGVYAIYEPGQFEEVISFLIVGAAQALLFDTGLGIGDIRSVVTELTDLDVVVLNSHTHYDHVGGNFQFASVFATDTDFTRRHQAGRPHEMVREFIGQGWVWKAWPAGFQPDTYRSRPFDIARRVRDGDLIDLGGRTLEVLLTPGHAPDALCLIDRDARLLFVGDTFYLAPLYAHLDGSDPDQYRITASRLAGLVNDVDWLMTAHNVPMTESRYLLELDAAFTAIHAGRGEYALADGHREYNFGDFSVIVPDTVFD